MKIVTIETTIIDIPFRIPATFSYGVSASQSFVIVQMQTDDGIKGLGEAAVLGDGPYWNEETAETVDALINRYLRPLLLGKDPLNLVPLVETMERTIKGNYFAKAAVEMALLDIVGKALNQPVYNVLGGLYQEYVDLSWTLATGDASSEIRETRELWHKGHRIFKFKVGFQRLQQDIARIEEWRSEFPEARIRVDANQGWDEITTLRADAAFRDLDVELIEQPLPRANLDGMSRLRRRMDIPIMADESVCTPADAIMLVRHEAADIFSLKPAKAGGLLSSRKVAAIAEGAGIPCYVGCMRETGIGTAAYAHFAAATPMVSLGCELFGPLMLTDDIVVNAIQYESGRIRVPGGPGLGVTLDEEKMAHYARSN